MGRTLQVIGKTAGADEARQMEGKQQGSSNDLGRGMQG